LQFKKLCFDGAISKAVENIAITYGSASFSQKEAMFNRTAVISLPQQYRQRGIGYTHQIIFFFNFT